MRSAWIWVLILGIVLFIVFIALYIGGRSHDIGAWVWGLLFLSLFVILLAAIIQMMGKDNVPPAGEFIYHRPEWLTGAELNVPGYHLQIPGVMHGSYPPPCQYGYPRGLTMRTNPNYDPQQKSSYTGPNSYGLFSERTESLNPSGNQEKRVTFNL